MRVAAQIRVGPLDYRDYDLDDMGISNPDAITYIPDSDLFYVTQAAAYAPLRTYVVTSHEEFLDVYDLDLEVPAASIAYDVHTERLLIYDQSTQELVALKTDDKGMLDDAAGISRYPVPSFEVQKDAGMVVSTVTAYLYILDAASRSVVRVIADANGNYVATTSDDTKLSRIQLEVPSSALLRGLAYEEQSQQLYTLDTRAKMLYLLSQTGQVVASYDLSDMRLSNPRGLVLAPTADSTDNPSLKSLFVTDGGVVAKTQHASGASESSLQASVSFKPFEPNIIVSAYRYACLATSAQISGRLIELYLKSLPEPPAASENAKSPIDMITQPSLGQPSNKALRAPPIWTLKANNFNSDLHRKLDEYAAIDRCIAEEPSLNMPSMVDDGHDFVAFVPDNAFATTIIITSSFSKTVFERPITDDWDDVEERNDGEVTNNNDLELVFDKEGNQTVALRFLEINVPRGSAIHNAYIQFTVDEVSPDPAELTIYGEKSANSPRFTASLHYGVSSRPRTENKVTWIPDAWLIVDEATPIQRTPNIASIIQEIVTTPQWESGNALTIIISGTGERVARAFDLDPVQAPLLHIEFASANIVSNTQNLPMTAD